MGRCLQVVFSSHHGALWMWRSSGEWRATATAIVVFPEKQVSVPSLFPGPLPPSCQEAQKMVVLVSIGLCGTVCRGASILAGVYLRLPENCTVWHIHPRAEDHCVPGPTAVRETSLWLCFSIGQHLIVLRRGYHSWVSGQQRHVPPFPSHLPTVRKAGSSLYYQRMPSALEWGTCSWGICLLKAGTKPQKGVASWANASGKEVQSVPWPLDPVSSSQLLHWPKEQFFITVTWPCIFTRTVCLLASSWCARPGCILASAVICLWLSFLIHRMWIRMLLSFVKSVEPMWIKVVHQGEEPWEGRTQHWPATVCSVLLRYGYIATAIILVR